LLRRFRLRSLSYGGQVAPRGDAAGAECSLRPSRAQAQYRAMMPDYEIMAIPEEYCRSSAVLFSSERGSEGKT
jgi:hypothetical protein